MTNEEALQEIVEEGIELGAGDYVDLEALKIAAKALEKQVARKIVRPSVEVGYKCPLCDESRSWKDGNYCKDCGQMLDWSD